ncbi:hypothetical protein HHI36_007784 [Cryptolaemus montrouzieri]|uniref:Uncharacterized protein n=1 Tax=Cryptolaemus montrouzieri TaxID=559131 RepID=A0ABD2MQG2_9CUCU
MDVPAGKSVCVSSPLSENEDIENEEIVNNAAVRNAEKLILEDNSSDDICFDEIDVEPQKGNEICESVEWKKFLEDDPRFTSVIPEVGKFDVFT